MSNFAEFLKQAKSGRVQVYHEFLTNYDPSRSRLHCFYEGREDEIFYRNFLQSKTPVKLLPYVCGNKDEVYGVLESILKHPGCHKCFFFVDKDLSDILRENRRTHERLFSTGTYSIENYIATEEVLGRFCQDFIQCRGIVCDHERIKSELKDGLHAFYDLVLPLMAWIVAVRRKGQRPNLRNIQLKHFFEIRSDLRPVKIVKRFRVSQLCKVTGIAHTPGLAKDIREALQELRGYKPKQVVRGKFEIWFFVEFIKKVLHKLKEAAELMNGSASMIPAVEHSSVMALAAPVANIPVELEQFLAHTL